MREERGSSRYREDYDEEYRPRRSSSRRYEEDDEDQGDGRQRRRGYSENVGQGGWFGDREGRSKVGRRGGQVRHERAMRARPRPGRA